MQDPTVTAELDLEPDPAAADPEAPRSTFVNVAIRVELAAGTLLNDSDITHAIHRRLQGDHLVAVDVGRPSGDAWMIFTVPKEHTAVRLLDKVTIEAYR